MLEPVGKHLSAVALCGEHDGCRVRSGIDAEHLSEKVGEQCSRFKFCLEYMYGEGRELGSNVCVQRLRNVVEEFQNWRRRHLESQLRDIADHLLVHHPVALLDPRRQFGRSKELLHRYSQCPMESTKEAEELLLLAVAH